MSLSSSLLNTVGPEINPMCLAETSCLTNIQPLIHQQQSLHGRFNGNGGFETSGLLNDSHIWRSRQTSQLQDAPNSAC